MWQIVNEGGVRGRLVHRTARLQVPGGWLYRHLYMLFGEGHMTTTFVPDKTVNHQPAPPRPAPKGEPNEDDRTARVPGYRRVRGDF